MVIKHFFIRERNQIRFHNCVQIIFRKSFYPVAFLTFQSLSITLQIEGLKINTNAEVFFPMLTTTDFTTDVYVGNYKSSYFLEYLQSAATARQYSYFLRFRSCFLVFPSHKLDSCHKFQLYTEVCASQRLVSQSQV